jgi:hypothetical protein
MTVTGNGARASNLQNITIYDLNSAEIDEEFDAVCVRSSMYKTSLLYGEKKLLFGRDLFKQITFYVENLRPMITKDELEEDHKRFLFTTSRKKEQTCQMTQSAVSNCLTKAFELAGVLCKDR